MRIYYYFFSSLLIFKISVKRFLLSQLSRKHLFITSSHSFTHRTYSIVSDTHLIILFPLLNHLKHLVMVSRKKILTEKFTCPYLYYELIALHPSPPLDRSTSLICMYVHKYYIFSYSVSHH